MLLSLFYPAARHRREPPGGAVLPVNGPHRTPHPNEGTLVTPGIPAKATGIASGAARPGNHGSTVCAGASTSGSRPCSIGVFLGRCEFGDDLPGGRQVRELYELLGMPLDEASVNVTRARLGRLLRQGFPTEPGRGPTRIGLNVHSEHASFVRQEIAMARRRRRADRCRSSGNRSSGMPSTSTRCNSRSRSSNRGTIPQTAGQGPWRSTHGSPRTPGDASSGRYAVRPHPGNMQLRGAFKDESRPLGRLRASSPQPCVSNRWGARAEFIDEAGGHGIYHTPCDSTRCGVAVNAWRRLLSARRACRAPSRR